MRQCAVCFCWCDAPTCPNCGEASWFPAVDRHDGKHGNKHPVEPTEAELEAMTAPTAPVPQDSTRRGRRR